MPSIKDRARAALPARLSRSRSRSRSSSSSRLTPLGPHLALADTRGGSPRVTELSRGAWLVRQRTKAGRDIAVDQVDEDTWLLRRRSGSARELRALGPDKLRLGLLLDPAEAKRRPLAHELHLLRHLGEEHVGILLKKLDVNVVLDVGANQGQYGTALRAAGYTGRIVSFEPVPATADILEETAAQDPDWHVRRCALGDVETTLDIHVGVGQGRLSSLLPASDFGKQWNPRIDASTTVAVPVKRLDGILDELVAGIDEPRVYLKLDTQGFDLQAFAGAGERIKDLLAMQSEVSMVPLYEGMPHFTEQLATYERAGFELTGMFPVIRDGRTMRVIEFDAMMVRTAAVRG